VFEQTEKVAMLARPVAPYDVPVWDDAVVHEDHHVQAARALYSVPTQYRGKKVRVRSDKIVVKIYFKSELIKVHERKGPGERSTDPNDYPAEKSEYAMRSVDAALARAKTKGPHVGEYASRIVAGPLPWARMRQVHALLRLCDKHGAGRVEAVCQSALAFDVVDVPRIARMLQQAIRPAQPTNQEEAKVVPLGDPKFARSPEHFRTRPTGKEGT
jgi:hypothetical protein